MTGGEQDSMAEAAAASEMVVAEERKEISVSFGGWVYHLGVNSVGREYCHLRFLVLRGRFLFMYKRDPSEHPGIKPIRKGVLNHTLMVEEVGRRNVNNGELYVLKLYNRLDGSRKGEIACGTAGEARKWLEAFEQAKLQAENQLLRGGGRDELNTKTELNFEGHRPRVRRYANGLRKLVRIGKGPEVLIRRSSNLGSNLNTKSYREGDVGDAIEAHKWRCIHTMDGLRIFQDVADQKVGNKGVILKSVGVVNASIDTVFEVVLSLEKDKRYEWDILTGDLELVESVDGHCDVVYGTYDPKFLPWWNSKKDFVFSRQWLRGQDGSYIILQIPTVHKEKPPRSGYKRTKIYRSVWEISKLNLPESNPKSLVTHMLEVHPSSSLWDRWKRHQSSDFEKTVSYALLCQVAGLKEYFEANPALRKHTHSTVLDSRVSDGSSSFTEFEDPELKDEFYDAIADGDSSEDDSDEDEDVSPKKDKLKLKNVSWAIATLALKRSAASIERSELDEKFPPLSIDSSQFHGSLHQGKGESDSNCWSAPSGRGFMIRGKNYLSDNSKVTGGDPLLKLLAVDWLKSDETISLVASHPKSLVQSEAGRKLPFILVVNLQIPAKPNYSLVMYYGSDRPIKNGSLLEKFVNGTDVFRDARFKLIPSIIEGYWMVKRAVGTKACLLGRAVTCRHHRQSNFLEIDVDIGSSSVARRIINLVLGYITSIVVDLAILIEAKEENELPEYILGTVRLNRLKLESATPL